MHHGPGEFAPALQRSRKPFHQKSSLSEDKFHDLLLPTDHMVVGLARQQFTKIGTATVGPQNSQRILVYRCFREYLQVYIIDHVPKEANRSSG